MSVVNVALPSIGRALDFRSGDFQWVVSAYVLFSGGLLLLGGRLADLIGRRSIFLAGLTVFTAASVASGCAGSPVMLIVSRAAQGGRAGNSRPRQPLHQRIQEAEMGGTAEFTGYTGAQLADQRRRDLIAEAIGARAARTARGRRRQVGRGPLAAFNAWLAAGQL